jgi:hypothetical protein
MGVVFITLSGECIRFLNLIYLTLLRDKFEHNSSRNIVAVDQVNKAIRLILGLIKF